MAKKDSPLSDKDKDKRASAACERCRKRHVRCSGGEPCETCAKQNAECIYLEAEKKIVVTLKYWKRVQEELKELKHELSTRNKTEEAERPAQKRARVAEGPESNETGVQTAGPALNANTPVSTGKVTVSSLCSDDLGADELINPIREQRSELTSTRNGQRLFSGSSSTSRFGLEVACMLRDRKLGSSQPESIDVGLFTYRGIRLTKKGPLTVLLKCTECNNSDYNDDIEITLPPREDALRFLGQFQLHLGNCYYFVNELWMRTKIFEIYSFLEQLHNYQATTLTRQEASWYSQILLISAIGEMYGSPTEERKNMTDDPPGGDNFRMGANALSLLYGKELMGDCCTKLIELLLCYSFYLQVLDFSTSSAVYIGMAMRTAILCGLHVDAGKDSLTPEELEHRRRLWWTTYILELYSCSKQGIPPSLNLESVATGLPSSELTFQPGEFYDAVYMNSFIEVARLGCLVLDSLYHHHNDNKNILPALNTVIEKLFEWRNNIPDMLKVDYSQSPLIVSRPVVNIHSEYFQCINLSVRPLLIHFVQRRISSLSKDGKLIELTLSKFSPSIRRLLNASFQASICSITAVSSLLDTGLLAVQGYMDREYVFVSAATLVLFGAAFGSHESIDSHIETAIKVMVKMHDAGNKPASLRLEQLISLRNAMKLECRDQPAPHPPQVMPAFADQGHPHPQPPYHEEFLEYATSLDDNNLFNQSEIPELSVENALDRELFDELNQHPLWMGEWLGQTA